MGKQNKYEIYEKGKGPLLGYFAQQERAEEVANVLNAMITNEYDYQKKYQSVDKYTVREVGRVENDRR